MTEFTRKERNNLLLACCLAAFITPLTSTMMNLSLPGLGKEFDVGSHSLGYVNSSFLLCSVLFLIPFARLGDIHGKRRIFLLGNLVVICAAVIGMASCNFSMVIVAMSLVGVGSAAVVCMSLSMIVNVFPPGHRGVALGYNSTCVYMGLALGPGIGGILNETVGWRSLFVMIVFLSISAILAMLRFKREFIEDEDGHFDYKASSLYMMAILLSMGGLINLPNTWSLVLLGIGIVMIMVFAKNQMGQEKPLLDMKLFKNRLFSSSCITAFISYATSYSLAFFMAQYLQNIQGFSPMQAGGIMITQSLIQATLTTYFGKLSDQMPNPRVLPILGMLIIGIGLFTVVFYTVDTPLWMIIVTLSLVGLGFSIFCTPNTSLIMSSAPLEKSANASAMVSVMRQTGMLSSMGIALTIISLVMGSADNIALGNHDEFMDVMRIVFTLYTILCTSGVVLSLTKKRDLSEI